jgi:hypothetical protein
MLVHRPKPRQGESGELIVLLVPELCVLTGLTDVGSKTRFNL